MEKIKKKFGNFMLKLLGFKVTGELPTAPKYVCVLAPHTSILDMFYGKFYNWAVGMETKIMVKKEFFFFPIGSLIRAWGGIPINRKKGGTIVEQMVHYFNINKNLILTITPEGTRAKNPNWKTGFYRIAVAAKVPIYVGYADFKTKTIGFMGRFKPTGDLQEDIKTVKRFYKGMEGFYKSKFTIGNV